MGRPVPGGDRVRRPDHPNPLVPQTASKGVPGRWEVPYKKIGVKVIFLLFRRGQCAYNPVMPRSARVIAVKQAHLVFQRSVGNRAVFSRDQDRQAYLDSLREMSDYYKLEILAYCLMREWVHLVVRPKTVEALALGVGRAHFAYTHHLHSGKKKSKPLWRGRFQSCPVDQKHLLTAVQFVECQPVYGKLVRQAQKYAWSSAGAHVNGADEQEILAMGKWGDKRYRQKWAGSLKNPLSAQVRRELEMYTQTGRPLGDAAFVRGLERKYGRRLHALPVGRPKTRN